jgi:hypothetical protein
MPVVFEEIVAEVEPEATPAPEPRRAPSASPEARTQAVRRELSLLAQRADRLRAD